MSIVSLWAFDSKGCAVPNERLYPQMTQMYADKTRNQNQKWPFTF
ncbi:MAG TPA: hypothetical protein VLC46_28220 [Thermoanaerobaculia bacterium]|nr:hypothetical protein [Thermoanaerobaculia bacterium]